MAGSGGAFMDGFLRHVVSGRNYATGAVGTPTDFLSFHAKGAPEFVDGHVRLGIAAQLRTIDTAFATIAAVPALRAKPIVIGESDPDGCAACQGPQLGYRNTSLYASYTAAVFARKPLLAARHGVDLEGALTWAFEFEDQPYFAGQRTLANNGIDLPVMNVFRMFSRMSGRQLEAASSGEQPLDAIVRDGVRGPPDVGVVASSQGSHVFVLLWHYHDDDVPGPAAAVSLVLQGLGARAATVTQYRVDGDHSNSFAAWRAMGSPSAPSDAQYARLLAAGQLEAMGAPVNHAVHDGALALEATLPRQSVALIVLDR